MNELCIRNVVGAVVWGATQLDLCASGMDESAADGFVGPIEVRSG